MPVFLLIGLSLVWFAAWLTHVVTCILAHEWLFMIIGAFIAPIGVVHGVMIWAGVV